MASVNKVILVGNVGKDPEVRYLENGVGVARFSLATSDKYKNKNGEVVTTTEWHNIVLWRGLAELAEKYIKKGSPIYVEGKIKTRSWQDDSGNKKYMTEIEGDAVQLLGAKGQESVAGEPSAPSSTNDFTPEPNASDDLPF